MSEPQSPIFNPISARRIVQAACAATVLIVVFAACVFTDFDGVRVKVDQDPVRPVDGVARVLADRPSRIAELRTPFAVIVRIHNESASPKTFALSVDGHAVCQAAIPASASKRTDCIMASGWHAASAHEVTVRGETSGWSLDYVELATHHGGSSGLTDVRLVPAGSPTPVPPSILSMVFGWLLIVCVSLFPPAVFPKPLRIGHVVLSALVLFALGAAMVLPHVSPYTFVLSAPTFWRWLAVLAAARLWSVARSIIARARAARMRPAVVSLGVSVAVALAVFGFYERVASRRLQEYRGNYSGFLRISSQLFDANPLFEGRSDIRRSLILDDGGGYDGQFMYAETFDPLMRRFHDHPAAYRQVVDAAPYRYDRIGFSLLTKVLSGNVWQRYPAAMVWIVLLSTFACALFVALLARHLGASPLWGLVVAVVPGFSQSLQLGLPEPLAAAMLVGGYFAAIHRRWFLAALFLAVSLLVRETGAIFVVCLSVATFVEGRRKDAVRLFILSLTPFVLWRLYVGATLFSTWGWSAFFFDPHDLGVPFGGFVDLWRAIFHGEYFAGMPEIATAGIWYPIVLTSALALAACAAAVRRTAASVAAVLYGVLAVSLNFPAIWVHVGNGQRGTYEVFIMLALVAVDVRVLRRDVRVGLLAFWGLAAVYVFYAAFDAPLVRGVLWS